VLNTPLKDVAKSAEVGPMSTEQPTKQAEHKREEAERKRLTAAGQRLVSEEMRQIAEKQREAGEQLREVQRIGERLTAEYSIRALLERIESRAINPVYGSACKCRSTAAQYE